MYKTSQLSWWLWLIFIVIIITAIGLMILYIILFFSKTMVRHIIPTIDDPKNIKNLYRIKWSDWLKSKTKQQTDEQCLICLEEFTSGTLLCTFEACGKIPHTYCWKCMLKHGYTRIEMLSDNSMLLVKCPTCSVVLWSLKDCV